MSLPREYFPSSALPHMRSTRLTLAVIWGLSSIGVGAVLASLHVPFFSPATLVAQLSTARPGAHWSMIHLLRERCQCSQGVAEYLLQRGPLSGIHEDVVVFGQMDGVAKALEASGFQVTEFSREDSARFSVAAVPAVVLLNEKKRILYSGGYAAAYQNQRIPNTVLDGEVRPESPLVGCALEQQTKSLVDPLSWKYRLGRGDLLITAFL